MFQKELGDKIMGSFKSNSYGRLSIISNWKLNIEKICDIKPDCFSPKPKIDSSLLYFEPKKDYFIFKNPKNLEKINHPFKLTHLLITSQTLASTSTEFLGKLQTQYIIEPSALTHAFHICKVGWPRFLAARIAAPMYKIQI